MIVYGEPSSDYHASGAIGSGQIRAYLKSPRLYRDHRDGIAKKETPALLFGIASHLRLLEPEAFRTSVAIKPQDMSFATKEGKAWRDEHAGKAIVGYEDSVHLARMHERMPTEVHAIFQAARTEVTVRTRIEGLPVQCRPDALTADAIYDLKTIADIDDCERSIWKLGYHIQSAWYRRVYLAETGKRLPFCFVFAEKAPPYRWRLVDLSAGYEEIADEAIDRALHGIDARLKSGCWDDPEPLRITAEPPEWMGSEITTNEDGGINL